MFRISTCCLTAITSLVLLTTGSSVRAQESPIEPAASSEQPGESQQQQASDPATMQKDTILLNSKEMSVQALLEYLSETAGLVILDGAKVEGRVTVMSRQPMTAEEAMSLLDTILKEKGYAAIRVGRNLKIVTLEQAAKENIPVYLGNDPSKIPVGDKLITQVIPIRFADATKLKEDLSPLISSQATLSANAASNALILVDTQTKVRRIVQIIQAVDRSMAGVSEIRVFQLQYANATNTAKLITELFKQDGDQADEARARSFRGRMRTMFGGRSGRGGGEEAQSEEEGRRQPKVIVTADDLTNTLVVSAPSDLFGVIENIIKELDSRDRHMAGMAEIKVFQLQYANATTTATLITELFKQDPDQAAQAPVPTSRRGRSGRRSRSGADEQTASNVTGGRKAKVIVTADDRTNTVVVSAPPELSIVIEDIIEELDSNPSAEQAVFIYPLKNAQATLLEEVLNDIFSETTTSTGGAASDRSRRSRSTPQPSIPSSATDLAGQVYVVANEDTNSLLVRAATKHFERVKEIIAELDRAIPQVLIKVLIAEVRHDDLLDLGTEFSVLNLGAGIDGTFNLRGGTADEGRTLVTATVNSSLSAVFNALQRVGKIDVLSRPYILASDNQEATITVGQEVPFIRNVRVTESGQTINDIEYEDVGIILNVTPHINPQGLVIMDVSPEISTLTDTTVPLSEGVDATVIAKRSAQTRVAVSDGETIVIGGLMEDLLVDDVRKVPVLGDIPLLGDLLFKRTTQSKVKTELLIFITPQVAKGPEDLKRISDAEKEKARSGIVPNAVEEGAFEKHMEGMQGVTSKPAGETDEPQK